VVLAVHRGRAPRRAVEVRREVLHRAALADVGEARAGDALLETCRLVAVDEAVAVVVDAVLAVRGAAGPGALGLGLRREVEEPACPGSLSQPQNPRGEENRVATPRGRAME
jgi:hypothetical protein